MLKAYGLAKVQAVIIVAAVALAAVAVGLFVATRGPSTTPVTSPGTTSAPTAVEWCGVRSYWVNVPSDLTTRPFAVRTAQMKVEWDQSWSSPIAGNLSVTIFAADGNEPVATGVLPRRGDSLEVQAGAGTYYIHFDTLDVRELGGYHVHVYEAKTGADACPSLRGHVPETDLAPQ